MFSKFFKKSNKMNEVVNNSPKIEAPKIEQPVQNPIQKEEKKNLNVLYMTNEEFGLFMDQVDTKNPKIFCEPIGPEPQDPSYDGRDYNIVKIVRTRNNFGQLVETEVVVGKYDTTKGVLTFQDDVKDIVVFVYGAILMFR